MGAKCRAGPVKAGHARPDSPAMLSVNKPTTDRRRFPPAAITAILSVWLIAVVAGFAVIVQYSFGAGPVMAAAADGAAVFTNNKSRHTLLVLAHPKCPCTRATMSELDRLMTLIQNDVDLRVLVYVPGDEPESWAEGDILRAARRMPNTEITIDRNGELARSFGAATSGHVMLLSPTGEAQFSGGVTIARGHEGASAGRRAILDWIETGHGAPAAPVFGCALFGDETVVMKGGE